MGLLKQIATLLHERRLKTLKSYLVELQARGVKESYLELNRFMSPNSSRLKFTQRLAENMAWFSGDAQSIKSFYRNNNVSPTAFWRNVPDYYLQLHTGIPALISNRMATVLFGAGIDITVECVNENRKIDTKKSEELLNRLNVILEDNNIKELLNRGAAIESYSGHLFAKISVDTNLTDCPILEFFDLRNAEVIKERGRVRGYQFKEYFYKDDGKKIFVHYENYAMEANYSVISHKLTKLDGDKEIEVPLTAISETSDLEPLLVLDLDFILADEKPNKLPNNEFIDHPFGASDYTGAYSSFDALDEVYSELVSEARRNKSIRYIPRDMVEEGTRFNEFGADYISTGFDKSANAKNEISITHITDKTDDHHKKFITILTTALNIVGLAPATIGVTGLTAIDSSDATLRERQRTTLETRQSKVKLWEPFLARLFKRLLIVDNWLAKQQNKAHIDFDFDNITVKVAFNDYVDNTFEERLAQMGQALQSGAISLEMAIAYLYGDELTPNQRADEVNRLRFERGMTASTPELQEIRLEDDED